MNDLLISFASWEDRYRLGFDRNIKNNQILKALVFSFDAYTDLTRNSMNEVTQLCKNNNIEFASMKLSTDQPSSNWKKIIESICETIKECQGLLIDISTMPREIIWYILWLTEQESISVRYVYYSPEKYGDWVSRDPRPPRLVYKLSGIALPSAKTALLITTGFDLQRVRRLINWFEPAKLMIGVQIASQFSRNDETIIKYRDMLEKKPNCDIFELDAFDTDRGMEAIKNQLESIDSSYNIIMSSLGPKLTSVSLYMIKRNREEIGLVYTPSAQYNPDYSRGIGRCFDGIIYPTQTEEIVC